MTYKSTNDELWSVEKGDWASSNYYDKEDLLKQIRRRNLIYLAALMTYICLSAFVLFL